ncbi:NADPH oxidase 2-like isoform X1 [Haliotis cracherodii]|uniref:NADPH oxidase 2-like isoform X1 n=1 Tax=Haliotis cracherodii TaxID=6455 RepID=UPI0039ED791D
MGDWLVNEGPKWFIVGVWLIINVGIFAGTFVSYQQNLDYFYLRLLVGDALCWARASAACLNFNCLLILLPVCRNLISSIRAACSCCHRNVRRQLDKNLTYHRYLGYMICLMTAIHIVAHCFDFEYLVGAYDSPDPAVQAITYLSVSTNGSYVNPIRTPGTDPTQEVFKTVAGVSGVVITLCLILIVTSSTDVVRRSYFEVFWFTHHLFVIFYIGLVVHGLQGIIRGQTNTAIHDPAKCYKRYDKWGSGECPIPQFSGSPPKTWIWVLAPVVLYIIERVIRFCRSLKTVVITKVVKHQSNVFELQMMKKGFSALPGQYVFLQCSSISRLEWHPFTLTSSPNEDFLSVHVRSVGDWTEKLAKACHVDEGEFQEAWKMPRLAVDGPFGTATEDFFRYEVAVLIGAGIGVTPFAAVLKNIWYKYCDVNTEMSLKKVHFFWVCPDTHAFEWFQDLLKSLEQQTYERGNANFLSHNIYLTRGWDTNQAKNIMIHDDDNGLDPVTGLSQKTHYGRPQWDRVFASLAQQHPGVSVGVFFCGPKELSTQLHKLCNKYSSDNNGTRFFYNKENF